MTERYSTLPDFNTGAVSDALAAENQPVRDFAHGDGSALHVGNGKAVLEVFPTAGVARLTTAHARLELRDIPGYTVDAEKGRVVFEHGTPESRTRLIVQDDGKGVVPPSDTGRHLPRRTENLADPILTPSGQLPCRQRPLQ
jgi:hypothetical protein